MNFKVRKELKKFKEFKQNFKFEQLKLSSVDGAVLCGDTVVKDKNGTLTKNCEKFVDVGYKLKGEVSPLSKLLSNLFPYEFWFRGKKVHSIESVLQAIKFPDKKTQNFVFKYSGTDCNNIKVASPHNWQTSGTLFWQGRQMDRFSKTYQDFVDELFISAVQNPIFRNALKSCNKYILHSIGITDNKRTVLTRYELECELNALSSFLKTI
jgi:hypothetical protein